MNDDVKPCDLPCEKCGATDIHRVFRANGSTFDVKEYGRARNKYASAQSYVAVVHRDHISHYCRTCGFDWQTLPMRKTKRARPTPEAKERT